MLRTVEFSKNDMAYGMKIGLKLQEYSVMSYLNYLGCKGDFVFACRKTACKQMPLISTKPDTFYRHYVRLEKLGLIKYRRESDKITFTDAGCIWEGTCHSD